MRIAPHLIEGTPEHKLSGFLRMYPEYTPSCAWPDDCMVQWGNGIIPAVPFFEAFPPGTFIRGEGETIAEAEAKAFAQYEREFLCNHLWGRQRPGGDIYTNGAGWCRKCRAFRGSMFKEITTLGRHRKPLSRMEMDMLEWAETDNSEDRSSRRYYRLLHLRRNLFGRVEQVR